MRTRTKILLAVGVVVAAGVVLVIAAVRSGLDIEVIEREHVHPATVEDLLQDDKLEDKQPVFLPALSDSRPFGPEDNRWQLNLSAAVIRLDVPDVREDRDAPLHRLYASYGQAARDLRDAGYNVLPSVNMIGGKAKQFDDGLYAAIDAWAVRNAEAGVRDLETLIRQILTELNPANEPYAWLWASLEVGGLIAPDEYPRRPSSAEHFVAEFMASSDAQPVGFYNWSEELRRVFRMLRYLQQPHEDRAGIPDTIARVIADDALWHEQYVRVLDLYAGMTNPFAGLTFADLAAHPGKPLAEIAVATGLRKRPVAVTVHFLPFSDSRENALFEKLYAQGMPPDADLMRDFITAIRDGTIDLKPREGAGWYEYQIHALETFLLPEQGRESEKLLLTKKYKLRMLEAFKAAVTKTRETHIRQMAVGTETAARPPAEGVAPRLRCEPNPTYFLRMARSYAFLQQLLMAHVSDLNSLRGFAEGGAREMPLGDELESMRMLFYGLYFVSCEDIGLEPETLDDEIDNAEYLRALAAQWLKDCESDPDLDADTRVAVPVLQTLRGVTRYWGTIGVRPIKLHAYYAKEPSWRPRAGESDEPQEWEKVPRYKLQDAEWIILADEFAEFERDSTAPLTRETLRDICNEHKEKTAIVQALGQ